MTCSDFSVKTSTHSSLKLLFFRFSLLFGLFSGWDEQAGPSPAAGPASIPGASLVAEHRLEGAWASVVVVLGLSCSKACGIFPDPGSNLHLLHWQTDS